MSEVIKIKLDKIVPNRSQPRLDFYDDSIEGLADSIRENGLLQPVTVRKVGPKYELIAGERRFRACCLLGRKEIDAIVLEKTDEESANLALIENLQREDLNAIEQALAMKRIMASENITQDELALKLASSGFRDMTRLAMSNVDMAEDMILMNNKNIKTSLAEVEQAIKYLKTDYKEKITQIRSSRAKMYDKNGKNIL